MKSWSDNLLIDRLRLIWEPQDWIEKLAPLDSYKAELWISNDSFFFQHVMIENLSRTKKWAALEGYSIKISIKSLQPTVWYTLSIVFETKQFLIISNLIIHFQHKHTFLSASFEKR